jgi:hypothetical protein
MIEEASLSMCYPYSLQLACSTIQMILEDDSRDIKAFSPFLRPLYKVASVSLSAADIWSVIDVCMQVARHYSTFTANDLHELKAMEDCLNALLATLDHSNSNRLSSKDHSMLLTALYAARAAIAYALADSSNFIRCASASLIPSRSSVESPHSTTLAVTSTGERKLYVVTMASNTSSTNLQYLRLSAEIAGVDLQVLISDSSEGKFSYRHKIHAYHKYLSSSLLMEDDIVVFIDAYDVLVYPSILNSIIRLDNHQSLKPIIFCAEYGIYPELIGPVLIYPSTNDLSRPRFLNSGCILGRVKELRFMTSYAYRMADIVDDDQQILVRFVLEHPDLVHIDSQGDFFFTGYRSMVRGSKIIISPLLEVSVIVLVDGHEEQQNSSIIASHFNNMKSYEYAYYQHVRSFMDVIQRYYSGEDGSLLLQAMRHYHLGDIKTARQLVNHPIVSRNRTSFGGQNIIGDMLGLK